ncbi:hypothetical protein HGRIS_002480 [Hohenbuehelia grisea]|uniref:MYND-type domain-containing protein n=1 Tax=Hohenbuehelia grisea TaxID=104357 RepID=A0ABR3JKM7_9AGAR
MRDFKSVCSYCNKTVPRQQIKKCANCQMVRYCSRDCQKAAWPTHKRCCSTTLRDELEKDVDAAEKNAQFTKWLNFWRETFYKWSLIAMHLSKHPHDRLSTHCFVVEVERNWDAPSSSPGKYYRMADGNVLSRDEVHQMFLEMSTPQDAVDSWKTDIRGNETVQIVIFAEGLVRMIWFSIRDIEQRRTPIAHPEARALSDYIAEEWAVMLQRIINSGDPKFLNI